MSSSWFEGLQLTNGATWIQVAEPVGETSGLRDSSATKNSDLISNPEDRALLFAMREQSDAILVSAKTAIAEHYRPSKFAPIYVVDRKGTFTSTTEATPGRHAMKILGSVEEVFERHPPTHSKILLESGRTMAKSLIADGLVTRAIVVVVTPVIQLAEKTLTSVTDYLDLGEYLVLETFAGEENTAFLLQLTSNPR